MAPVQLHLSVSFTWWVLPLLKAAKVAAVFVPKRFEDVAIKAVADLIAVRGARFKKVVS